MKKTFSLPLLILITFILGGLFFNRGFSMSPVITLSSSSSAALNCVSCNAKDMLYRINESDFIARDFDDAVLSQSMFEGQSISGSTFVYAVLTGIGFDGVDGTNADFTDADMRGANIQGADFSGATFIDANMSGAGLGGSTFDNADFTNVNFSDAYLTGSSFTNATFTGAIWFNTSCPDGTNSDNNGNTCIGHLIP